MGRERESGRERQKERENGGERVVRPQAVLILWCSAGSDHLL